MCEAYRSGAESTVQPAPAQTQRTVTVQHTPEHSPWANIHLGPAQQLLLKVSGRGFSVSVSDNDCGADQRIFGPTLTQTNVPERQAVIVVIRIDLEIFCMFGNFLGTTASGVFCKDSVIFRSAILTKLFHWGQSRESVCVGELCLNVNPFSSLPLCCLQPLFYIFKTPLFL